MKQVWRLFPFVKPYIWPHWVMSLICMAAFGASSGALPFLGQGIFDNIFANKDRAALTYIPAVVIAVFAVRGLLNFGQHYLSSYVGLKIINDIRNAVHSHLQTLSLAYFHRNPTGTLISRVNNDVNLVRGVLTDAVASFMRDAVSLTALTIVAFLKDPLLASIAFVVFPASVYPVTRLGRKLKRFTKRGQVAKGLLTSILQESIQGNRIVKAFGMERYEIARFQKENARVFKQALRGSRTQSVVQPSMELMASFAIGTVVWYGGHSVIAGGRSQGEFIAFLMAMFLMYQPFKNLTRTYTTIQSGIAGADRIFEVLDTEPEVRDRPGAEPAPGFSREIAFHGVSFGYGGKVVLSDINLNIRAGEMVALVGVSGVGKSTLADLVPRFYDVTSGEVTIDGMDIRDVTVESLRSQIGIVTQQTFLFNDTVKNNIAYGDPTKDMDQIVGAAKAAHAHEFILAMPEGYDTMIGELGVRLSGGQRQRLAIARALLKNAPILILDEATSSLDTESERLVQRALENLIVRRTTLVIAHRLSTIRNANRIVVLVDGRIAEEGTHEELLGRPSEYKRLHSLQLLEDEGPRSSKVLH